MRAEAEQRELEKARSEHWRNDSTRNIFGFGVWAIIGISLFVVAAAALAMGWRLTVGSSYHWLASQELPTGQGFHTERSSRRVGFPNFSMLSGTRSAFARLNECSYLAARGQSGISEQRMQRKTPCSVGGGFMPAALSAALRAKHRPKHTQQFALDQLRRVQPLLNKAKHRFMRVHAQAHPVGGPAASVRRRSATPLRQRRTNAIRPRRMFHNPRFHRRVRQ